MKPDSIDTVVIVNDFAHVCGGNAKVAIETACLLRRRGLFVYYFAAVAPVSDALRRAEVTVVLSGQRVALQHPSRIKGGLQGLWNHKAKAMFVGLLSTLRPERTVIHFHGWQKALSASLFSVVKQLGFPAIVTAHDYFLICPNGGLYDYQRKCHCPHRPLSMRCLLAQCDKRGAGEKYYRYIRQLVQKRQLRRSVQGVLYVSDYSRQILESFHRWKGMTGLMENRPSVNLCEQVGYTNEYVGYIGRISPEKGADLFCEAVAAVGCSAVVIGDGEARAQLQAQYPHIHFTGWLAEKECAEWMRRMRVLVFPSRWHETDGLSVREALACYHVPCIVANPSAAAVHIREGENGWLFETGNAENLREKLLLALQDHDTAQRREFIRLHAKQSATDEDQWTDALLAYYQEVLRAAYG